MSFGSWKTKTTRIWGMTARYANCLVIVSGTRPESHTNVMHKSRHRCTGLQEVWELRERLLVCGWADLPDVGNSALETLFSYPANLLCAGQGKEEAKRRLKLRSTLVGDMQVAELRWRSTCKTLTPGRSGRNDSFSPSPDYDCDT